LVASNVQGATGQALAIKHATSQRTVILKLEKLVCPFLSILARIYYNVFLCAAVVSTTFCPRSAIILRLPWYHHRSIMTNSQTARHTPQALRYRGYRLYGYFLCTIEFGHQDRLCVTYHQFTSNTSTTQQTVTLPCKKLNSVCHRIIIPLIGYPCARSGCHIRKARCAHNTQGNHARIRHHSFPHTLAINGRPVGL
jgi:hypothetical protein